MRPNSCIRGERERKHLKCVGRSSEFEEEFGSARGKKTKTKPKRGIEYLFFPSCVWLPCCCCHTLSGNPGDDGKGGGFILASGRYQPMNDSRLKGRRSGVDVRRETVSQVGTKKSKKDFLSGMPLFLASTPTVRKRMLICQQHLSEVQKDT